MHADCLPGASVSVTVDDEALQEYHTENDTMTATTYIEVTAGANFTISLVFDDEYVYRLHGEHIRFCVSVDGEHARASIRNPFDDVHPMAGVVSTVDGVSTLRRFCFSEHTSCMSFSLPLLPLVHTRCID
jgi:hypothetical protein